MDGIDKRYTDEVSYLITCPRCMLVSGCNRGDCFGCLAMLACGFRLSGFPRQVGQVCKDCKLKEHQKRKTYPVIPLPKKNPISRSVKKHLKKRRR